MKIRKYTKEILEEAITSSKTWSEVCVKLGLAPLAGSQYYFKKRAVAFEIPFGHLLGRGWALNKKTWRDVKLEDYLSGKRKIRSHALRLKLIEAGLKEDKCESCGLSEWDRQKIPLELDHINSNHEDNRLENLQILCPNCHAIKTRKYKNLGPNQK